MSNTKMEEFPCPFCHAIGIIKDDAYEDKCEPCDGTGKISAWNFYASIDDMEGLHKLAFPNCPVPFAHCHEQQKESKS